LLIYGKISAIMKSERIMGMLKRLASILCLSVSLGCLGTHLHAGTLVTFDNLDASATGPTCDQFGNCRVPDGYVYPYLQWPLFYVANGAQAAAQSGGPGYLNGTISQPNMIFALGDGWITSALPGNDPNQFPTYSTFDFSSAYITSAFGQPETILVEGLQGGHCCVGEFGTVVYSQTITVTPFDTSSHLYIFDFNAVSAVHFTPSNSGGGGQFVVDNITLNGSVPEPTTLALGVIGLLAFTAARYGKLGLLRRSSQR
jgi:hypothetical protein